MKTILIALAILVTPSAAIGCIAKETPGASEEYQEIFIGKVTGIHMTSHESYEIKKITKAKSILLNPYSADIALPFNVSVVVKQSIKGDSLITRTVTLGGCGVLPPSLLEDGIFFIGHARVIAIFPSDGDAYQSWLRKLDKKPTSNVPDRAEPATRR